MPCDNPRVSYTMNTLMAVAEERRQRDELDRLLNTAAGLSAAEDVGELAAFLASGSLDRPLVTRLAAIPPRPSLAEALAGGQRSTPTGSTLRLLSPLEQLSTLYRATSDERLLEAIQAHPLDSPTMLRAARNHGVDERILREVHDRLTP